MNRITKYMSILGLALAILLCAANSFAAITLDNIGVARDGDSVIVTISTSGPAQFNAFITDNKPERIVIDLDNVANNIPQIDFANLPFKSIHAIRTSQFKTEPTLQARVVLNVRRPISFKTYRNGNDIIVKLPTAADEVAFARWSAVGANADTKLAANEPKKEELKPAPTVEAKPAPAKAEIAEKPVIEPTKVVATPIPQAKPMDVEKAEVKPEPKPVNTLAPKEEKAAVEPVKEAAPMVSAPPPPPVPAPMPASTPQVQPAQAVATPSEAKKDDGTDTTSDEAYADAPAEDPSINIEPSARRKVIGYDPGDMKDPFAPLIGSSAVKLAQGLPSLENMKLVGILQDIEMNRALLEDADGNGYMMKPNDKIRGGYLVSVTDNTAIFQVTEYGWTRTVALELEIPEIK